MALTRRELLCAGVTAAASVALGVPMAARGGGAARKPNFVVIYCDDLGYGDLGCYGSSHIRTPHLDALAGSGVRFTDWYSNAPVCSPSRAALLTGRYPARTGVDQILGGGRNTEGLPAREQTIASLLKPLGYRTTALGKWHLGLTPESRPNAHGFDDFFGFLAGCEDYYSHIYYYSGGNPLHDLWHNEEEVWDNGHYLTELIAEKAVATIKAARKNPFFLYVAFNAPHYPMHAPQKYLDRYRDLPPDRRIMAAMISAVDDGVGQIMAALKKQGVLEDTVVFFSSDNGPSTESRNYLDGREDAYYGGTAGVFRGHKASLFDGGIREPAILSWPGHLPAGRVCHEPLQTMDVLPTFLDAAGIHPPGAVRLDGASILPVVAGKAPSPHQRLFWEYNQQLAAREGRWKLVLNGKLDFNRGQPDAVHLSDLEKDPGERTNLAAAEPEITRALTDAVRSWRAGLPGAAR